MKLGPVSRYEWSPIYDWRLTLSRVGSPTSRRSKPETNCGSAMDLEIGKPTAQTPGRGLTCDSRRHSADVSRSALAVLFGGYSARRRLSVARRHPGRGALPGLPGHPSSHGVTPDRADARFTVGIYN